MITAKSELALPKADIGVLGEIFLGLLVVDGWSAYFKVICEQQSCMAHLLRKIRKFRDAFPNLTSIVKFYLKLRRILRDGERLQKIREQIGEEVFERRLKRLKKRLEGIRRSVMNKIEKIDSAYYRVKLPQILTDSTHGEMHYFELVTARIADSDGAEGVGYTYAVNHGGASIHAMIDRDLNGHLIGEDPGRIEALWEKMWWAIHYPGRGGIASFAIAAIDIALWDLMGHKTDLPLWRLLGGHNPKVPAYAGGIDLLKPLPELIEQTDRNLNNGFRAIKMKVGRPNLSEDVERVAAMRCHLGQDFPLMADANMHWSRDEALKACQALRDYSLFWIEEPLIPEDETGHAMLATAGGIPIAAGENFRTIHEFARLIRAEGVMFPEPDVSNCGGITPWMKIAALAECNNLKVTSHGVHDLHVHLLAAVPNKSYLEVHGFGLERYIADPLSIEEGFATAPVTPGHGVVFDWDALEKMRV